MDKNEKDLEATKITATTQITIAKMEQDPNQISQTEMDVFNTIKKYDILNDPAAFQNMVNNSTDKEVKQDALTLEKDLAKLGMHLKVDGKIDNQTIAAVESVVSKNIPAIMAYEDLTGTNPIKPSSGGTKPAHQKEGR